MRNLILDALKAGNAFSSMKAWLSALAGGFPGLARMLKSSWLPKTIISTESPEAVESIARPSRMYPKDTIALEAPTAFGLCSLPEHAQASIIDFRATSMFEFVECRVTGIFPVIISRQGGMFADMLNIWRQNPDEHEIMKKIRLITPRYVNGLSLLLATSFGENYYHWLIEQLPQLHLATLAGYKLAEFDHIIASFEDAKFVAQSLAYFSLSTDNMLRCTRTQHWHCERLVAFNPSADHGIPTKWGIRFMRSTILKRFPQSHVNISTYICRALARGRRVKNEEEVMGVLRRQGFQSVFLEEMSFDEQVDLFASAEVVVGPHGAGFANILFAPEKCLVVEFIFGAYPALCYAHLSRMIGQRYGYIVADEERTHSNPAVNDMTIPLAALERLAQAI